MHVLDTKMWERVLRIKTCTQKDWCNELKTPLEDDILASQKQNHVSYITKKPKINKVLVCMLQNKEREIPHNDYT